MRTSLTTPAIIFGVMLTATTGLCEELDYGNADRILPAAKALPPEMVEGEHFKVLDPVVNVFTLDQFRILAGTGVPVGLAESGRVVAFDASDFHHCIEYTVPLASDFNDAYKNVSRNREVWIAGNAAASWKAEVEGLGWKIRTGTRTLYLPKIPWGILPTEEAMQEEDL